MISKRTRTEAELQFRPFCNYPRGKYNDKPNSDAFLIRLTKQQRRRRPDGALTGGCGAGWLLNLWTLDFRSVPSSGHMMNAHTLKYVCRDGGGAAVALVRNSSTKSIYY